MDPTIVANAPQPLPLETGVKLAHHATEHGHEPEKLDLKRDGHVNPLLHAIKHSWKAATWGAGVLLAFTAVLKSGMLISETLMGVSALSVGAGIALAGAVWYGAQSFMKAYQNAQDHNHGMVEGLQERVRAHEQERGHAKGRGGRESPARAILGAGLTPPPVFGKEEAAMPASQPVTEQPAERPEFLKNILDQGPRQLSPKELAARIHEERSGASQLGA